MEQLELIRSLIAFNDLQNVRKELCHGSHRMKEKKKTNDAYLITIDLVMRKIEQHFTWDNRINSNLLYYSHCAALSHSFFCLFFSPVLRFLRLIHPQCWFLSLQLWCSERKLSWKRGYRCEFPFIFCSFIFPKGNSICLLLCYTSSFSFPSNCISISSSLETAGKRFVWIDKM